MPLRGLLFLIFYISCAVGALFAPHLGVYGYIVTYCIGPEDEWWSLPFRRWGIRFSYVMAAATALGFVLNASRSKQNAAAWNRWETFFLLFVGSVWLSTILAPHGPVLRYTTVDPPSIKMLKIAFFLFLYTRLITDVKKVNGLMWIFVASAFVLGYTAWEKPWSAFQSGRLEGVGGADFAESNFFGAFMGAMLPLIGAQFLGSRWRGRIFCIVAAAFSANAVILTRSRGALVGLAAGVLVAAGRVPRAHRKKVYAALLLGVLGGVHLMDTGFIERTMTMARPTQGEQLDASAASRPRLWKAAYHMMRDHWVGVGAGRWFEAIEEYIPEYRGKDAHSTFGRAMGELGFPGLVFFVLALGAAFKNLAEAASIASQMSHKESKQLELTIFGVRVSLIILLVCALFITMTYTEALWILLALPTCLVKAAKNELARQAAVPDTTKGAG